MTIRMKTKMKTKWKSMISYDLLIFCIFDMIFTKIIQGNYVLGGPGRSLGVLGGPRRSWEVVGGPRTLNHFI